MHTNPVSPFIQKPARSCLKPVSHSTSCLAAPSAQHFTLCCGSLKMGRSFQDSETLPGCSLLWECLSISLDGLNISLEMFYFSPPNLRPRVSRTLSRPLPLPLHYSGGSYFCFYGKNVSPLLHSHSMATYWRCACPHNCMVNSSCLPGNLEPLNKVCGVNTEIIHFCSLFFCSTYPSRPCTDVTSSGQYSWIPF